MRSRWGDAWSLDAWLRRRHSPAGTPTEYGATVWLPGVVLGVTFAAAAFAKLREGGLAWITNGTVKYHFLSDSHQAMVDWGLQLGQYHAVAVMLSFGAIAIESRVIVGVFARRYRYRLLAGSAAWSLLAGFVLLQGVFWPAWWMLLLSFLPWHLVPASRPALAASEDTAGGAPETWRLQSPAGAIVVRLVGLQLAVSLLAIEGSPLLSTYDMYSTTYASSADYEAKAGDSYWLVATDDAEQLYHCRIRRPEADRLAARSSPAARSEMASQIVRRCFDPALPIRTVAVEGSRVQVDWAHWRLEAAARVRLTDAIPVAR